MLDIREYAVRDLRNQAETYELTKLVYLKAADTDDADHRTTIFDSHMRDVVRAVIWWLRKGLAVCVRSREGQGGTYDVNVPPPADSRTQYDKNEGIVKLRALLWRWCPELYN